MTKTLLGTKIRKERLNLGLTQETLAEEVDLTTAYIGQIERGERNLTLDNLIKVANCLNVTIDYLLSDSLDNDKDSAISELSHLLCSRSDEEKQMVINVIRDLLRHLDEVNADVAISNQ